MNLTKEQADAMAAAILGHPVGECTNNDCVYTQEELATLKREVRKLLHLDKAAGRIATMGNMRPNQYDIQRAKLEALISEGGKGGE